MKGRWSILGLAVLLGGFFMLRQVFQSAKSIENPRQDEVAYFSQIHPVERELEDVRRNLREFSRSRATLEAPAKIVADAERERQSLRKIHPVPSALDSTHRDLMAWSDMLYRGAVVANGKLSQSATGEIESLLSRADKLYGNIERRSSTIER